MLMLWRLKMLASIALSPSYFSKKVGATMVLDSKSGKRRRASGQKEADGSATRPRKAQQHGGPLVASMEEAQLAASLFGGSMPLGKRVANDNDATVLSDGEADADDDDGASGFMIDTHGQNSTEQYLDDDQLFTIDNGEVISHQDEEEGSESEHSEPASDLNGSHNGSLTNTEDVEDQQEGPSKKETKISKLQTSQNARKRRPAWTDSASENLMVPLTGREVGEQNGSFAGTQKLRRLREGAEEREVSGTEYERRLRQMFERLHPRPSWASLDRRIGKGDSSSKGASQFAHLLSRDAGLVKTSGGKGKNGAKGKRALQADKLDVVRLRDGNEAQGRANLSQIEALEFHPSARAHVMLTASKDRRLRLFQINGTNNPHLETIHFPDLPIKTAHFDPTGISVILSGPRPFFYAHDLESGKTTKSAPWRAYGSNDETAQERDLSNLAFAPDESVMGQRRRLAIGGRRGAIYLLDWGQIGGSGGGSMLGTLRMNAPLSGMAWDPRREHRLVTMSTQGTLHTWDVRNMQCEVQRKDAGLFAPLGLAASPAGGDFWAAGSDTGIVNIYGRDAVEGNGKRKAAGTHAASEAVLPLEARKSVENIVTASTTLRFNPTGEILAIASDKKRDALKLMHLPTMRIFDNWPTSGTPLGRITAADFSRRSEYLALGNHRGKVLLYSLPHFQP